MKIQKLDLLISVYIFCITASELMGGKTFPVANLGGYQLNASVAILVLPLVYGINDTITEVFGITRARSLVRSGLVVVVLILLFSVLATGLPPSVRFKPSERAYDLIFGTSARIAASSLTAFAIGEFLEVLIFVKIRQKFGKSKLWLRNNLANFLAQFTDTAIFMILAFYALDKNLDSNVTFLWSLILPYWLLKCFMSVIETPLVYLGVHWLKNEKK